MPISTLTHYVPRAGTAPSGAARAMPAAAPRVSLQPDIRAEARAAGRQLRFLLEPLANEKSMGIRIRALPAMLRRSDNDTVKAFERNVQIYLNQVEPGKLYALLENLKLVRDPAVRGHAHFRALLKAANDAMARRDMPELSQLQTRYDSRLSIRASQLLRANKADLVIEGLAQRLEQGSIDEQRLRHLFEQLPEPARRQMAAQDPVLRAPACARDLAVAMVRRWCSAAPNLAAQETSMNMSNLHKLAELAATHPDYIVEPSDTGTLALAQPLNPPGLWTQFKAALAQVPLLGQLGALRQARAECACYPLRLRQYQANNRQVLAGFVKTLRAEFGDYIVDMTRIASGLREGAPLTARHVSTAIEQARNAKLQCRARNEETITRLLENWRADGLQLSGDKFIAQQVMGNCAKLPEYSNGRLPHTKVVNAMSDAVALYDEIRTSPGMTPAQLQQILADAAVRTDPAAAMNFARELAIMRHVDPMLDRKDARSVLSVQAAEAARRHGLPALSDAVLKSIAAGQIEQVRMGCVALPRVLACQPGVTPVVRALKPVLKGHIIRALDEHCQALKQIDSSTTLNPAQKQFLRDIASRRRMDPTQLAEYEKLAARLSGVMNDCARCAGDPSRAVSQLLAAVSAFEASIGVMGQYGTQFWESQSLGGGDMAAELTSQFVGIAAAGVEDPLALLNAMSGDAMKAFVQGIGASPSLRASTQLRLIIELMIESLALSGGMSKEEATQLSRHVVRTPVAPRSAIKPALILSVLTCDPDPELVDSRGVVSGARNGQQVDSAFNPQNVLAGARQLILDYINEDEVDEERGIARTTAIDLGRGSFHIGGDELPRDGAQVQRRLDESFPDNDGGRRMKLAVSRCMNQLGINLFFLHCDRSAFGPDSIVTCVHGSSQIEAWPQGDGSWVVRNTYSREPNNIVRDGELIELPENGVALYSLTYHVKPSLEPGGDPTMGITGSHVVFDF